MHRRTSENTVVHAYKWLQADKPAAFSILRRKTMKNINKLEITARLERKGALVSLENGDKAININIGLPFGKRYCRFDCTAYGAVAVGLAEADKGADLLITGAIYQDTVTDKQGKIIYWPKIRINNFKIMEEAASDDAAPF